MEVVSQPQAPLSHSVSGISQKLSAKLREIEPILLDLARLVRISSEVCRLDHSKG